MERFFKNRELPTDRPIATIPVGNIIGDGMTLEKYKIIASSPSIWNWGTLGGGSTVHVRAVANVVIDGIEFNPHLRQYGENTLCLFWGPIVGNNKTGAYGGDITQQVRSFDY